LGDVTIGLNEALNDLKDNLGVETIEASEVFATSSAAGGLKMTVHGLVYDMTVKAAKEAALGAGANIKQITAGKLSKYQLNQIEKLKPNIILIAGGVDYGERDTALHNASEIARMKLNIPVIYAGNCENQLEVKEIFTNFGQTAFLYVVANVYPKIDTLNVEPTRKVIQDVFEKHIIHAPGMEKVRSVVNKQIIPTPGSVMTAANLLKPEIGDLIVFDVGGATTDLHSVTSGSERVNKILIHPEPVAKRTVEGDLGVYVNYLNIIEMITREKLLRELNLREEELDDLIDKYEAIPTKKQIPLVERLTLEALLVALDRHAGQFRHLYGTKGRTQVAEGKDLTNVKYLIGTGGALTRLPNRIHLLQDLLNKQDQTKLAPGKDCQILIDNDYIMASLGVLSLEYPEEATNLLKQSLRI
jgi:uncharacterized protein (TIGR01319 family)